MKHACIVPGSFDPVTKGHVDIIERAANLFDMVHVGVLTNTAKQYMFPIEARLQMVRRAVGNHSQISVRAWDGLLVAFAEEVGCYTVVRGLRDSEDYAYEKPIADANRILCSRLETVFIGCSPENACVSSSIVREILRFGGDVSGFVPHEILSVL